MSSSNECMTKESSDPPPLADAATRVLALEKKIEKKPRTDVGIRIPKPAYDEIKALAKAETQKRGYFVSMSQLLAETFIGTE